MADEYGPLTRDALSSYFDDSKPTKHNAILQCLHIKPISSKLDNAVHDKYRIILSDGDYFVQTMLGAAHKHLVTDEVLKKNSIVELAGFQPQFLNSKRILIISQINVLAQYGEPEKYRQPVSIDSLETGAITAQPQNVSGHNFYGNNNTPQKPAQESYSNKPAPQDSTHGNIYPIPSLSPYAHKWTIRARVSRKSPIKSWHNQKGEGRLFSVTFVDEDGEIRATIFSSVGDNFDRWFELLQEGTVYFVSTPCSVKFANKKFNQSNNDYELTFEKDTGIEKAHDQTNVPSVKYNFTSIEDLQRVDKDTVIDCIGVVTNIGEVGSIVGKSSGKPFDKREITIADETRHEVRLTLWGDTATTFDVPLESIIACKGLKVSDFGGRSLSLLSSGSMQTNPDIEESHRLRGWYDAQGRTEEFANHNALQAGPTSGARNDLYKTIAQIKEENLGQTENAEYFTLKATVLYMKHEENKQLYYPSCKSEKCNKKVNEDEPGQWHCVACEKNWDSPQHRYILHLSLGDHTGQLWMDAFDDGGQLIMGVTADELHNERENDTPKAKEIIDNALCTTWVLRCRAKLDTYGDQQRVRYQIMTVSPVNYTTEAARLAAALKAYSIEDNSLFVN